MLIHLTEILAEKGMHMPTRISAFALLAALAIAAPGSATERKPDPPSTEIIVQGTRKRDRQISDFVNALTKAPMYGQISRYEQPVCPATIGLSPAQNKSVASRLRRVAEAAGVTVGQEDCKPNTFIIVAQDKEKMVKVLRENWADALNNRVQVPKQSGPAVAVHLEGRLDPDGNPAGVQNAQDGGGTANHYVVVQGGAEASWRIKPASRPHFLLTALVVEADALVGLTTTQLADYAAMRLLARTDPSRLENSAAPTILSILEAPINSEVPITLTDWDFGFLKALYASDVGRYAGQQRGEIRQLLKKELDAAQKGRD